MELTVLMMEGCPNADVLDERLALVLAGRGGVPVTRRVITDEVQAARRRGGSVRRAERAAGPVVPDLPGRRR